MVVAVMVAVLVLMLLEKAVVWVVVVGNLDFSVNMDAGNSIA